ncbi:hypothetical protein ACGFRB_08615 [Streptomyces sp. NPDC048718]|uniref:hypothetical protein n=1 Tax=Streptomyces sp. NPDC048718 TaxID=3365587 RepID=UPI003717D713
MSWEVLLFRMPANITSAKDLPVDYSPPLLGTPDEVAAAVRRAVPEIGLSDCSWGELLGPTWSMDISINTEEPEYSLMLHIREFGDDVLPFIFRIADALDCRALDLSSGDLLAPGEPSGRHAFQEYRDRVLGGPGPIN